jgi:hypothetical protein
MTPLVTINEYRGWLQYAKDNNLWLIMVYHKVSNDNVGAYDTTEDQFINQMAVLENSALTVMTVKQALAEITAQL